MNIDILDELVAEATGFDVETVHQILYAYDNIVYEIRHADMNSGPVASPDRTVIQ
jgi:hypothetical protein